MAGFACLLIGPGQAQVGIIAVGDQVTVRCYTQEQVRVYVTGAVERNGAMLLPGLGAVPMAGRGIQTVRDDLGARYGRIYPGCTVAVSVVPGEGTQPGVVGAEPQRDRPLAAGDVVGVRCRSGDAVAFDVSASVATDGTVTLPGLQPLPAAGLTVAELQDRVAAACIVVHPDAVVEVRLVQPQGGERPLPEEIVRPTVELTAAARFAALPRFGMDVFAGEEAPGTGAEATAEGPPAGQPRPAAAGVVAEAVPLTYVIGPGDELAVRVWTDAIEHVKANPVVDADGRIYLDLVGEVTVGGQRLGDVREDIRQRYARFFNRASVSVGMSRTRVIEVRVTGDAARPGKYTITGAATLFSALYAAGGPSEIGSLRAIRLLRAGREPVIVDLYDYLLKGDIAGDLALEPEDTIFIPPARDSVGIAGQVRRPARYEVVGRTTLADALELAAGIAATGYAHNIQVWRIGDTGQRQVLDVNYSQQAADLVLQDGDLVVVQPALEQPENVVELSGAVQRPGAYQVTEGMTVRELIAAAQGLTEGAYTKRASLWRLNDLLDYEVSDFDLAAALRGDPTENLALAPRDRVVVYSEEKVEAPREVQVKGAVRYPSIVPWTAGMKVSDLILQAGSLTDQAYLPRAQLLRVGPDQRRQVISVALADALAGDPQADLLVERGDVLRVFERGEVVAPSGVRVAGLVKTPGTYQRYQSMRVSDAILAAGGLQAGAGDEVEYTQFGGATQVQPIYLRLERVGDAFVVEPDPALADNDLVAVLGTGGVTPMPAVVTIKGEVARPGSYALQNTAETPDTVYDLLQRAGGRLPNANPNGIVLYRLREEIIATDQADDLQQVIQNFNRELSSETVQGQQQRIAGLAGSVTAGLTAALGEGGAAVVVPPRVLDSRTWARAVPIDGERLVQSEGQEGNFALMNGDVLVVPRMPRTLTVMGAVVRPGALPYVEGRPATEYVQHAGGTTTDGVLRRMVIIHANGSVTANALRAQVQPGDVLLVPSGYLIKHINKPGTLERILSAVGAILTGYLIIK